MTDIFPLRPSNILSNTIFGLFCLALLVSCNVDEESNHCPISYKVTGEVFPLKWNWKLIGFREAGSTQLTYPPCRFYESERGAARDFQITLQLTDEPNQSPNGDQFPYIFSGVAPVNAFGGGYTVKGDSLLIGNVGTTLVAGPNELMEYESRYYKALLAAHTYKVVFNLLVIYFGEEGESMLLQAIPGLESE
ncbi:META domain-containing protein [Pararhodonellum marinum]|uniref:META domain-containing protein n=1 Tax=Pararhodonellum marinum TaxID=2755358 RepID=UPI00188E0E5D|nr:META domain-containing protein [Pararhodonellum marinum]